MARDDGVHRENLGAPERFREAGGFDVRVASRPVHASRSASSSDSRTSLAYCGQVPPPLQAQTGALLRWRGSAIRWRRR